MGCRNVRKTRVRGRGTAVPLLCFHSTRPHRGLAHGLRPPAESNAPSERREAIELYARGGRDDLVKKESLERVILADYLPAPLTDADLRRIVTEAVEQLQAKSPADIGRVMAAVMPKVKGPTFNLQLDWCKGCSSRGLGNR